MELILKETIDTLGQEGDVVNVKPGFGRNYLIPQGKAVIATNTTLSILKQQMTAIQARKDNEKNAADFMSKKISGVTVVIEMRVGEEDKLYGSVTSSDIAEKLAELGIKIDKRKIQLDEPIKNVSVSLVQCRTGYQMSTEVKVEFVPLATEE